MTTVKPMSIILVDSDAKVLTKVAGAADMMRDYLKLKNHVPMATVKKGAN